MADQQHYQPITGHDLLTLITESGGRFLETTQVMATKVTAIQTGNTLYPDTNPYDSPGVYNFVPWVQAPNTAHIVWKRQGAIAGLIGGPATQYGITASPGSPSVVYSGRCYQTVTLPNGTSAAQCYDLRTGKVYYEIPGGVTPSNIVYNNPAASGTTIAQEMNWDLQPGV